MDGLEEIMKQQNFTNLRPVPWKRAVRISNTTKSFHLTVDSLHLENLIGDETSKTDLNVNDNFLDEVNGLVEQTKFLLERTNKSKNILQKSIDKTGKLSDRAREQDEILHKVISQLRYYINYGFGKQDSSKIGILIQEANIYVNAMKERGIYIEKRYNRGNTDFELVILKNVIHFFF
ncbi:hypothetical protein WUBG_18112 [Wuchereria bancrofti]|uniref:Uncharacterized protein n=1 Tax=Wuchereria bancrofti TaxID=6293 RepID=J9DNA0_WUCBA|nr:hypothetical protein WUBG_18112 [Wuchereria bancrofti]